MSNKTFDRLKFFALISMPLIMTFIGVVLSTLNVPHADAIMTILVAFNTMIGGIVKALADKYNAANNESDEGDIDE